MVQKHDRDMPLPVFVLWGPDPDDDDGSTDPAMVIGVDDDYDVVESMLMQAVIGIVGEHLRTLRYGGTCSLLVSRGNRANSDGLYTTGSFAVNNPGVERRSWDFHIERWRASRERVGER